MYEITLSQLPAGYFANVIPDGHWGWILVKEFSSTDDGQDFIKRLEGLPELVRRQLPEEVLPSQIDHLLAIIKRDRTAKVYVNELPLFAHARVARSIDEGQEVMTGDLVDIDRLDVGVKVPNDAGVLFLFSVGWRKGLFFDLVPLSGPSPTLRDYDVDAYLGQIYSYVTFQERYSLTDTAWEALLEEQWFPFIGLSESTIRKMVERARSGKSNDDLVDEVIRDLEPRLPGMLENWRGSAVLSEHIALLERALDRFVAEDYISCSSILFPRIEGILRTHRKHTEDSGRSTQEKMVDSAVRGEVTDAPNSLLFPKRFSDYLSNVYFAAFDPGDKEVRVGRHGVSHGVTSPEHFDAKSAIIGILITNQLFYFLH